MVKRKLKNGIVIVLGRTYRLPSTPKVTEAEGQFIWIDDEEVIRSDVPKLGLQTAHQVRTYWPTRYDWLINASLDESEQKS